MAKKRRPTVRITPLGYIVLGILLLVIIVGVYFIAWSMKNASDNDKNPSPSPTMSNVTPTLPPIATNTPPSTVPDSPPPTQAPTTPPSTQTPEPTDTPKPTVAGGGVAMPSDEQVRNAVDGKLSASGVAFRSAPSTSGKMLGKYTSGTVLKIYAQEGDYYFCQIVKEQKYGYFATKFVTKFGLLPGESATPTPELEAGTYAAKVKASKVALRSVPSTENNTPVGECVENEGLLVYFKTGDFYYVKVTTTGQKGYVFAQYVTVDGAPPTGTPVP